MAIYKKPNLTSAIDAEGNWKHINEVASGLACGCFCPHCRARLIAINSKPESESKAHHFAHERGSDCIWSDESSLHKLAKEVLAEEQKVMLPIISGETSCRQLEFDSVAQESRDPETGLIPDCVCYYGGKRLWVEFKRTHEVDTRKAEKICNAKIDCIEIDLNKCEISKEAVRKFVVDDTANRIWVYNSLTSQQKTWQGKGGWHQSDFQERDYRIIDRHLAFDEIGRIVNAVDFDGNENSRRFFCLNCGKELQLDGNCFIHKEENSKCIDDIYLLKAAREIVYNSFNNSKNYSISIPQQHQCKDSAVCPFYSDNKCFAPSNELYELRKHGFSICEKASRIPGQEEVFDLILRRAESLADTIIVNFSTEDCDRDLKCDYRQIEIHLTCEADVLALADGLHGACRNFKLISEVSKTPNEMQASVLKFTLYKSGKSYIAPVQCTFKDVPRSKEIVKEYLFVQNVFNADKARHYCLLLCCMNKLPACYCELCAYLKRNDGYKRPICIRYKKAGTPKNPLDIKPCNCKYFLMSFDVEQELREDFKDIKVVEPNYNTK